MKNYKLKLELSDKENEALQFIKNSDFNVLLKGKDEKGIPYLKKIFELHLKIFGQTCSNCPSKITGYIQKLKNYSQSKNLETMSEINHEFKLKEGVIIPVPGTSVAYSSNNITDDIAVELLADNSNRKVLFEKIPEDYEQRISDYIENIELKEDLELPNIENIEVAEVIRLLSIAGVTTKATTVDGLNKKIESLNNETLNIFKSALEGYLTASEEAE